MIDMNDDGKHDIQDDMIGYEVYKQTENENSDANTPTRVKSKKQRNMQNNKPPKKVKYEIGGLQIAVIIITIILFFIALFDEDMVSPFSILEIGAVAFLVAAFLDNK